MSADEDHSDHDDKESDAEVPVKKGRPEAVPENNRVSVHPYFIFPGIFGNTRIVASSGAGLDENFAH